MSQVPLLERLEALDASSLSAAEVQTAFDDVTRLERFVASVKVRLTQRAAHLCAEGAGEPAAETVRRGCRASSGEAAKVESAAQTAAESPELQRALSDGAVGLEHLNAFGAIDRSLNPEQQQRLRAALPNLLDEAADQTPEQFRRAVAAEARQIRADDGEAHAAQRRRNRRAAMGTSKDDGMGWLTARLDPETASRVFAHVHAERNGLLAGDPTLSLEHATADAIVNLILHGGRSQHPGVVEVSVFIDLESLLHGAHVGGVSYLSSGSTLPVSHVRRLCCEARIMPMVLDGEGRPLDLGREQRLANRAQRRALRKLHSTCAFPGCEVGFDECRIHHVTPWELGGTSDLVNLAPLCSRHHHLVHEGRWRFELDADRTVRVHRPDGTPYFSAVWKPPEGEHATQRADLLEDRAQIVRARRRCRALAGRHERAA